MSMAAIMDGIATAALTVTGITNAYDRPVEAITVPCAVVGYPEQINFDMSFAGGIDSWVFPVWYVVGKSTQDDALDALSAYLEGTGSLKTALDGSHTWGDARATSAEVTELTVSGVTYLAVKYDCEVYA